MANVFDKFNGVTTVHKIKALDGAEVTLRELTHKESKELLQEMVKGVDSDGNPDVDFAGALDVKLKKISLALVDPKMSFTDLEALGNSSQAALDEIYTIVDPETAAIISGKGKSGKSS